MRPTSPIPDTTTPVPSNATTALLAFVVLTFGWTWGLWAVSVALAPGSAALRTPLLLASAFGPSLAGLAVVAAFDGRSGLAHWLGRCLRWKVGWGWYALAVVAPLALMALALALHGALGGEVPPSPAAGHPWLSVLIVAQILVLGGPLGEEFGWRGYALPALSRRMGWRRASLVVGVVWALWHLPLFWMAGMAQAGLPSRPVQARPGPVADAPPLVRPGHAGVFAPGRLLEVSAPDPRAVSHRRGPQPWPGAGPLIAAASVVRRRARRDGGRTSSTSAGP